MPGLTIDARMVLSSGIGRYLRLLLDGLRYESDWDVTVLGKSEELKPWSDYFDIVNVNISPYHPAESLAVGRAIANRTKSDLFFSPHFNTPLIGINARRRVSTIHDVFHLSPYAEIGMLKKVYAKRLITNCYHRSQFVITVSRFTRDEVIRTLDIKANHIRVIYNAVSEDSFYNEETQLSHQSEKTNDNNTPYLLFVGNLKPHKNLKMIVSAFSNMREKADLILVGRSFDKRFDRSLIESNDRDKETNHIILRGAVDDKELRFLYRNARSLVFPSLYEGFGLPPLESAVEGTPTILSDIPIFREIYGPNACYVDPYDLNSIALMMDKLVIDRELGSNYSNAVRRRTEFYDTKRFIKQHMEVFNESLGS